MFDHWRLKDFAPHTGYQLGAANEQFAMHDWIDVTVPGDVHQALIAAGRIQDPFYDKNELDCTWIEDREWWYRLTFQGPTDALAADERLLLIFHGLDTFVTIWLNGEELGQQHDMFSAAVFDVSRQLHIGQPNTLALCFDRPLAYAEGRTERNGIAFKESALLRKAQFGYGWDWGPRLPTVGIWRPVELLRQRKAAIEGTHFMTLDIDQQQEQALVSVKVEAERFATAQPLTADVTLLSPTGELVQRQQVALKGDGAHVVGRAYLLVDRPELWWTHDLGTPALYTLHIRLFENQEELAQQQQRVGIRTLALDQSPDPAEPGTRFFRFVLNGIPIFARGADWIPAHSFVGGIQPERYTRLLQMASAAHMNMLRVWGGGIFEHDVFYELCDQMGLLLWHDFMFACALYPEDDPAYVQGVEDEVYYQVRRLRNHASLALWCGNNENQLILSHMKDGVVERIPGQLYCDEIIPRIVKEQDGKTPYWISSPYGGNDFNSQFDGDVHNWQTWHGGISGTFEQPGGVDQSPEGVSYLHYGHDMGRFISEFGMHAAPVLETLQRNIPPDQLYHHSESMDHHNKDNPKDKGDRLMQGVTGLPKDLDEYIDFSMIAQAEGLKYGIEHYRRRKPHCSGTLIWQLNDCWPVLSWSIIDYYGFGKAGYYYTQRAYSPVLASFKQLDNGSVELWITNDTLQPIKDISTVRLGDFATGKLWEQSLIIDVPANSSQVVWSCGANLATAQPQHYLSVRSMQELFPANRFFFVAIKDLQREIVTPDVDVTADGEHELHVHIYAPAYVYFFHVLVAEEHTSYSDNYFDLEAGEERTIVIKNEAVTLTPAMVTVRWR